MRARGRGGGALGTPGRVPARRPVVGIPKDLLQLHLLGREALDLRLEAHVHVFHRLRFLGGSGGLVDAFVCV